MFQLFMLSMLSMAPVVSDEAMLPYDTRWEYPHYLTFRPGDSQVCSVNPPRFSWPYVPYVVMGRKRMPFQEFCLQLSRTGDFAHPDIEVRTECNFYNALPVLEKGQWFWRVGYWADTKQEQWSPVRSFTFAQDAVEWDRSVVREAGQRLAAKPHPRLSPPGGDWDAWRGKLSADERTARWLKEALQRAERITKRDWWDDFPETDRKGGTPYDDQQFARIAGEIVLAAFAYRLTGDERYTVAREHALALARFPKGGLSSPEYHGAPRKWPTQITQYLALCLDWWYDELSEEERAVLLNSIDWRLRATFLEKYSWRSGEDIALQGVAVFCQSHPYENFMWSLPAVLLTAGDLEVSDELVEPCLHYLTGVTSAHGPDEGWNEGLAYGSWKGQTMLQASMYTALLLPELRIELNPFYRRLGEWYAHLMPVGIQRLSFGDYAATPMRHWNVQQSNFRVLAWLTGDGGFEYRRQELASRTGDKVSGRPWLDLLCAGKFKTPNPTKDERTQAVFPEAGWVMVSTQSPSDREAFDDAVGMVFQCRTRGGFSHSFRAENDFVWYAYGQTLSAGAGSTLYPDPHSRHSMSHNVILINGEGQEWNPREPRYPFVGRLIAYREGENYVYWVGDATHAYQSVPGLLRWHRHVVFVDGFDTASPTQPKGKWFVILDDLSMRPDADPARFSWLFHVAPEVPLIVDQDRASFSYRVEDVHAHVALANAPDSMEIVDLQVRDGYRNLITGDDLYDETVERLSRKDRELDEDQLMAHNLWVTNREPVSEWTFLSTLVAWRDDESEPGVSFRGERAVSISDGGVSRTVSFDPEIQGDIVADLDAVRAHALATDPAILPPSGKVETVNLGDETYRVEWLAHERFDDWPYRWFAEGNSEAKVIDGKLWIRNLDPERANVATIWFRPELPADVIVRFRTKAVPPAEQNAANLNLFLHARELDGTSLRFGRSGQYSEYHGIPNYIVTFVGGYRPGWSRARRDPGFNLLDEADVRSEIGREYAIAVTVQEGRLRYYLDGQKVHDVQDPEPLPGGKFGIRTWSTNGWWDDVEIGRLIYN
jgi:hypothetical protein